jgi:hypothetical protein
MDLNNDTHGVYTSLPVYYSHLSHRLGMVSTQLFYTVKTISCNSADLPLLLERVGVRRIRSIGYIPLIPAFSRWRRSNNICVDTYDPTMKKNNGFQL